MSEQQKQGSERTRDPSKFGSRTLRNWWQGFLLLTGVLLGSLLLGIRDHLEHGVWASTDERSGPVAADVLSDWRAPKHDGANSLFLFWKLHGISADYQTLQKTLKERASLTELKKQSIKKGLPCAIVKPVMTSAESIKELQLPAIVLLDNGRGRQSGFHVVYCITEQQQVRMASGSEMTWNQVSLDDFLRHWTGHMLVTDSSYALPVQSYLVVAISGFVFVLYLVLRLRGFSMLPVDEDSSGSFKKSKPIVIGLLLGWLFWINPSCGYSNELPSEVRWQLKHNASQLDCFQATWICERELVTNDIDLQESIKQQVDPGYWLESRFEYRFDNGRYHLSTYFHESNLQQDTWQFGQPEHRKRETAFDGSCLFTTNRRAVGAPPRFLHIRPLERMSLYENDSELDVSFPRAAGYVVPEFQSEHGVSVCNALVLSAVDSKTAITDCQSTKRDGHTYLQVCVQEPDTESTFYLDPAMGYALVRHEKRDRATGLRRVTAATHFENVADTDLWLPEQVEVIHYSPPWPLNSNSDVRPVYIEQVTLEKFSPELTEYSFRLDDSQSGLCIADERLYPNVSADIPIPYYVVSMQEKELNQLVDRFEGEFANAASMTSNLWVGTMAIVVVGNLFLLVRLGRQRLTDKPCTHV